MTEKHRYKLLRVTSFLILTVFFSVLSFLPSVANAATLPWTTTVDPAFSVDAVQDKVATPYCNQEQVYLGNDTNEASVCVVKRDTWRYGEYTRDVCRHGSCRTEKGYAVGYGDDIKMYRMKDIPEFWAPYLVPNSNTMVVRDVNSPYYTLGIIKEFQLKLNAISTEDGTKEYVYNGSPYFKFTAPNGSRVKVQAVGASSNGNWLVAEAPDVGLFRVNLETLETKRFSNLVYTYWTGANPTMQFAVSNDGSTIAAMGFNAGFEMYHVTDVCVDVLTDTMTKSTPLASPCDQKDMQAYMSSQVAGFWFGLEPSFDLIGEKLNLQAYYQLDGTYATKWVTLAVTDSSDIGAGNCLPYTDIHATNTTSEIKCCITNRSYPYLLRQAMGKQAEKMKLTCSGEDGSSDTANRDAWYAWRRDCLNLDSSMEVTCKGISLEEFIQLYKSGNT